jgi:hypothetical protein
VRLIFEAFLHLIIRNLLESKFLNSLFFNDMRLGFHDQGLTQMKQGVLNTFITAEALKLCSLEIIYLRSPDSSMMSLL